MIWKNRKEAGQALATQLRKFKNQNPLVKPLVLALPRGGVPVASEIADELSSLIDVLIVRKIGAPFQHYQSRVISEARRGAATRPT